VERLRRRRFIQFKLAQQGHAALRPGSNGLPPSGFSTRLVRSAGSVTGAAVAQISDRKHCHRTKQILHFAS
jgi:hypothetical protein